MLVANRGEIAVRIFRACRELGIETVAVYSDADTHAMHARAADQGVRLGPAPAAESYLRIDRVIDAARASGADALHPGYGFLSEQADLARACAEAGVTFVGPRPETLAGLGDKLAARRRAADAGVAVVPGTFEPIDVSSPAGVAAARREAERIGWPLLVKAAAGGGGRGMRRVDEPGQLEEALASATREAVAAFGDGSVYLERFVERARHVEVQLLGDDHGNVVALGERDCSVQRRHQKLVEEAPAPGLGPEQRRHLHELGVTVASTSQLRNAATAEFLLTQDGEFWFLEVNARLQVEHGVTELVADVDLVHEQFQVAAGRPISERVLAAAARAAQPERHAIEVRLSAEHPGLHFAPAPGRLTRWREPAGPGVRVDAGVEEGDVVSEHYDPLVAKLLVSAHDRPAAVARLRRALDEFEVGGVQTTLPFHRWLAAEPAFVNADDLSTDLVERLWRPAEVASVAALRAAELAARAALAGPAAARPTTASAGGMGEPDPDAWWRSGVDEAMEPLR